MCHCDFLVLKNIRTARQWIKWNGGFGLELIFWEKNVLSVSLGGEIGHFECGKLSQKDLFLVEDWV